MPSVLATSGGEQILGFVTVTQELLLAALVSLKPDAVATPTRAQFVTGG
jgi:hypothetical protein